MKTTHAIFAAQFSQIVKAIEDVQAHVEQVKVEIDRRKEETEARWHRQQHEAIEQLQIQITATMQEYVANVSQQWHHHLDELHLQHASLQRRLTDEEQRRVHAEAHLLRLRRQRRMARRQQ